MLDQSADIVSIDDVEEGNTVMCELELLLALLGCSIHNIQPHVYNLLRSVLLDHEDMVHAIYFLYSDVAQLADFISLLIILAELLLQHLAILL